MPKRTYSEVLHSQPVGSTQRALQASLTGNIVFANEAIVDTVFQPSKVDDQTVVDILAEINSVKSLKTAHNKVLSKKLAERKKYEPMLALLEHITTYDYEGVALVNNDYARHVCRTWVDTHSQRIRTDPQIYLPGDADKKGEDGSGAEDSEDEDESDDSDDPNDTDEDDRGDDDERSDVFTGMKRKATRSIKNVVPAKFAKTAAQSGRATAPLNVIDDRRPDLTLVDVPVGEGILSHPYGRHSCLYIEVKVDPNKKPNPQEVVTPKPSKNRKAPLKSTEGPGKVKSILRQVADIARLHLATRPFMRYSLHITICGTIFNISLFDRAGGVVSKDYDLQDEGDFETFIRIIRRATCEMDAYELGLDLTVTPLDYLGSVARYPRFKVEVGENNYYTHDLPIWQSTTLQGRGTWVFVATREDNPNPKPSERLVLKNAWRASGRLPESTLYGIINKLQAHENMPSLRCVAEFVDGGDVTIGEEVRQGSSGTSAADKEDPMNQGVAMRVSSHRKFVEDAESSAHNPTLHRVVLATQGRSMASYASFMELLSAAECAAEGLHSLNLLGVDHRDVSIGNVLLGTDPEKAAGFISDLDLSSISEEAIKAAYPNDHDKIIKQMKDGEWRTGTALFMAGSLLMALTNPRLRHRQAIKSDFTFRHRLCHDFESLIWVVVYAMMIHHKNNLAVTDPEACGLYKEALDDCWAVHSYGNLHRSHSYMIHIGCSFESQDMVSWWFPDPREAAFFREAMRLLHNQALDGELVTYESLCKLFEKHIQLAKEPQDFVPVSN